MVDMKFAYVDESGDSGQSDVFVMTACLVDAYRLRRITSDFDTSLDAFLAKHPGHPAELKTKALINRQGGWIERKDFVWKIYTLAAQDGKLFASALSFAKFNDAVQGDPHPTRQSYWHAGSMFVGSLIQKKMSK